VKENLMVGEAQQIERKFHGREARNCKRTSHGGGSTKDKRKFPAFK
jgi:hypothetical protein